MKQKILALALGVALFGLAGTASAQFVEKKTVSLALAKKMATAAEAEATKNNWNMVITVIDDGGNIVYIGRMDGAQLGSIECLAGQSAHGARFSPAQQGLSGSGRPESAALNDASSRHSSARWLTHHARWQSRWRNRCERRHKRAGRAVRSGRDQRHHRKVEAYSRLDFATFGSSVVPVCSLLLTTSLFLSCRSSPNDG